jgi:hypothetical protein
MGSNWKNYLQEGKRVLGMGGEIIIVESIDRYDVIKKYVEELGLSLKMEEKK